MMKSGKTNSELITYSTLCFYFGAQYVFANPRWWEGNRAEELCDVLVALPYATLLVQVKESPVPREESEWRKWSRKKVFRDAVGQALGSAEKIRTGAKITSSTEKTPLRIDAGDMHLLIVFSTGSQFQYKMWHEKDEAELHVFSLGNLQAVLEYLCFPREIVQYP